MKSDNPLLSWSNYPDFSAIKVEHVEPAVSGFLHWAEAEIAALEAAKPTTWEALIRPLERVEDTYSRLATVLRQLMQLVDIPGWRVAYEAVQPRLIAFGTRLDQSPALFEALSTLTPADEAQRRILESRQRDARLAGIALPPEERDAFRNTAQQIGALNTRFTANILDAQKTWSVDVTDPASVKGMPSSWRALAASRAAAAGLEGATAESGPWRVTLDWSSLSPVLSHSPDRSLRETCRRASAQTAAESNLPVLTELLALRAEQAARLGFGSYLDLSLASKMAPSVGHIEMLLDALQTASAAPAQQEADELEALAASRGHPTPLQLWDMRYWSERMREERFGLRDEEVRPYFPLERVLEALFERAGLLFGVQFAAADGEVSVWHPDVRFFHILRPKPDGGTERIASFYLDSFSRPGEKRGGAWMSGLVSRSRSLAGPDEAVRCPVAVLVCNQAPPVEGTPSLMTPQNVTTLFHEFGHGLHHMLTVVDEHLASGISGVEWDAVELPSMWMEGWCTHRPTLKAMARHHQTGAPLPETMLDQIIASRQFRAATGVRAQVGWSRLDLALHRGAPPEDPVALEKSVLSACWLSGSLDTDRWICSFNHIFGGAAYAAGYFSYLWAEVLSTDAFSAFEELDAEDEAGLSELGQRFWAEVLSTGGSRHPMANFTAFRGREPTTDALLRAKGLLRSGA